MNIKQQWRLFRAQWNEPQWRQVRTLLWAWLALYALLVFADVNWWQSIRQCERLKDEVFRLQVEAKYAVDRAHFEAQWRHK